MVVRGARPSIRIFRSVRKGSRNDHPKWYKIALKTTTKPSKNQSQNETRKYDKTMCENSSHWGSLGSLLATLARLWIPLSFYWSSVWLSVAPPASSNFDFLAKPRKWIQNNVKMEPNWTQNDSKIYRKTKPKLTQNIECKTNLKCPELFKKHNFVGLDLNSPWLLVC